MEKMDKSEKLTVLAFLIGPIGLFALADSYVVTYCYGERLGGIAEFAMGITAIVAATVLLYIAGMMRDRRIQAEFDRRRAAREKRRAERGYRYR